MNYPQLFYIWLLKATHTQFKRNDETTHRSRAMAARVAELATVT